jgi:hypothetical protein
MSVRLKRHLYTPDESGQKRLIGDQYAVLPSHASLERFLNFGVCVL